MTELETATNGATGSERGFFGKLANGDFGLAKTYWLYGVLVGIVFNIISNAVTSVGGEVILILAHTAYAIPVTMGTWRAANKYQGPKIWAVLAKIAVVLGIIMLAVGLLMLAVVLFWV